MKKDLILYSSYLKESILDTPKDELNPKIFIGNKLRPILKQHIYDDIKKYLKDENIKSVLFMGSNTGYQYNDTSDIDIHIRIDGITNNEANELFDKMPKGVNLEETTNPINYFIYSGDEFEGEEGKGSVYDVLRDTWVVKPEKDDIKIPYTYLVELSKLFMDGIDSRINEYENDKKELQNFEELKSQSLDDDKQEIEERIVLKKQEIEANLDSLILIANMLYDFRKQGYEIDSPGLDLFFNFGKGNKSINNMIYKILEKFGYKEKLKKYIKLRENSVL